MSLLQCYWRIRGSRVNAYDELMVRQGFILIIVLSLLAILAMLSMTFFGSSENFKRVSQVIFFRTKSKQLAQSGFEFIIRKYQENIVYFDYHNQKNFLGEGTLAKRGDYFEANAFDFNGRININDGITGGHAAVIVSGNPKYVSNSIDPYDRDYYDDPWLGSYESQSAFFNLRLRRILNAYGDAHRFADHVFQGDIDNITGYYGDPLPEPVFSIDAQQSSDGRRGKSMAYNDFIDWDWVPNKELNVGLGDQIIMHRPPNGYVDVLELKDIVNRWARHERVDLSDSYLKNTNGSFYELIKDDLTITSFEDGDFYHIDSEYNFGKFYAVDPVHDEELGNFWPRDMQITPISLNGVMDTHHPAAPINLNHASFFVRAAVFYGLVNVSYSVEGATTIPPYLLADPDTEVEFLSENTGIEAMVPSPSVGVMGPVFAPELKSHENGHAGQGRSSHLMSLRDAMLLAQAYALYVQDNLIHNFDDFYDFLVDHETMSLQKYGQPAYERVLPMRDLSGQLTYAIEDPLKDFNAGGLFHVAPFESQGVFLQDYISKTLPHVLSFIRRIPSYYGAPAALQSPYMVHKPKYDDEDYKNGYLVRQGFRKVEDYVFRASLPKVGFIPFGRASITSIGTLIDQAEHLISQSQIQADVDFFETKYYRQQHEFYEITDGQKTHDDITIGPELNTSVASWISGVVGLKDYDQDLLDDPFMGKDGKGYKPQLIYNFHYDDTVNPIHFGFQNDAEGYDRDFEHVAILGDDPWAQILGTEAYELNFQTMVILQEGAMSLFNTFLRPNHACDLSPFNGVYLTSFANGEFVNRGRNRYGGFYDSLYWRLDDWLLPNDNPIGEDLSRGVMTFWFRLPSDYDYATKVYGRNGFEIESDSFSRVLAHLNLWERYQHREFGLPPFNTYPRAVSLTVGVKKTSRRGLNVFARYDSGAEYHDGSATEYFLGPPPDFGGPLSLVSSRYDSDLNAQYDFFGYWGHAEHVSHQDGVYSYDNYRKVSHRSAEVSVKLKNHQENGPGSWHRVSVFWNFYWDSLEQRLSKDQLYIDLHDNSNIEGENEFRHGISYASDTFRLGDYFDYPHDLDTLDEGANLGFMFPFDQSMIFSLGDSHMRRLQEYSIHYQEPGQDDLFFNVTSEPGRYYPFWRLNSCIDNFRLYMGSSDPSKRDDIADGYFQSDFVSSTWGTNVYGAMRYYVVNENHPSGFFDESNEPEWVINPLIENGSLIHAIGARVYYPPDSNRNTSYVYFSLQDISDRGEFDPIVVSKNEQDLFFDRVKKDDNTRLVLKYIAYKPLLDGDLSNRFQEPLIYHDTDNFTQIPWIKEVSIRYSPPEGYRIVQITHK